MNALQASATMTLGVLYHCLPAFLKDDAKARELLQNAQHLQPNTMQANYYLGAFLLDLGERNNALHYLTIANHFEPEHSIEKHYIKKQSSLLLAANKQHQTLSDSRICSSDFRQ